MCPVYGSVLDSGVSLSSGGYHCAHVCMLWVNFTPQASHDKMKKQTLGVVRRPAMPHIHYVRTDVT